jgi:Ni/Co efflux regulator RcnB
MKKFILGAIATTLIATPILAATPAEAQQRRTEQTIRYKPNGTVVVKQTNNRKAQRQAARAWRKGERFNYRQATNYRVVNDYRARRLAPPPRGYRYVQSGNDAVLVGITSGIIASVLSGALR